MVIAFRRASSIALLACILWPGLTPADEGFWLFSDPPRASLASRYDFVPSAGWFRHLMRSSAELRVGPDIYVSGAFVSRDGLFLTAFHVGSQVVEPRDEVFAREAFVARTLSEERKLPGVVVRSLVSTADVTSAIRRSSPEDLPANVARLEAEWTRSTGLQNRVVSLWGGAKYELYRYATYTDVRLVFCPDAAGAIVRDPVTRQALRPPDSFHFDICLFRAYENGKPARLRHHLEWSAEPAREGELVLISGSPIASQRLPPAIHLRFERDVVLPLRSARARRLELAFAEPAADSPAEAARGERTYWEGQRGLLLATAINDEIDTRDETVSVLMERVSQASAAMAAEFPRYYLLEEAAGFDAELFDYARILVRNPSERERAEHERQPMYAQANWHRLDGWMRAPATIDRRVQEVRVHAWLSLVNDTLDDQDPTVQNLLAGKTPLDRARELVANTRVDDIEFRQPLWVGGRAAVASSRDPMLDLVRGIESEARNSYDRKLQYERMIAEAQARIALTRSKSGRGEAYPEASTSLRLSYGAVQGYGEVPAWSTFGQLRAWLDARNPTESSALSPDWLRARGELIPSTQFNVATTADVIGGSSGSPVVNREGRLLGVMRGLNEAARLNTWVYDSARARSIYVAAPAMLEGLRKVYGADELADELANSRRHAPRRREKPSHSPRFRSKRGGKPRGLRALP